MIGLCRSTLRSLSISHTLDRRLEADLARESNDRYDTDSQLAIADGTDPL